MRLSGVVIRGAIAATGLVGLFVTTMYGVDAWEKRRAEQVVVKMFKDLAMRGITVRDPRGDKRPQKTYSPKNLEILRDAKLSVL
ncbi:hypothetical protein A3D70_02850 [Candidatus Adlerbacteria bacterium RIFCSPHIGHO2_02_FULL_54_18]|uniref:Uncharacterized protein n=2 Tax=Candidatus Adleribacteriota TaxID=1752736 RepID=A0A1F4Y346_9BACT|nr:MAG: hypothetical protein A2949_00540 [Candidatus Adlerbacteria bacterium RIFCSPLOWO2_01_FULL_54_21b]OGC88395.1 MAG: hypothetical protein A3D70_02850 [Candidatus Adlerbacteria bacterium RIFCSPHIGHO2_02_FULL_54_18]